jgi:hypothetical protein
MVILKSPCSTADMTAFWSSALGSLAEVDRRFRGAYCFHHQSNTWLRGAKFRKAVNFILTALRTWNIAKCHYLRTEFYKNLRISSTTIRERENKGSQKCFGKGKGGNKDSQNCFVNLSGNKAKMVATLYIRMSANSFKALVHLSNTAGSSKIDKMHK